MRLGASFYRRSDLLTLAVELLGKKLVVRENDDSLTTGIIVETEAYNGIHDRACHAYNGRRTARTQTMYQAGGIAYVYKTYGIHDLINIVTGEEGHPTVILLRAIEPLTGLDKMLERRRLTNPNDYRLTAGPGMLTQALGITTADNATDLISGNRIWLEETNYQYTSEQIITSPRVGVAYAGEDALLPYRFRIKDHIWTSRAK